MDFEKGKRTEISIFTEYVVRTAKVYGLAAPLHEKVFRTLSERISA